VVSAAAADVVDNAPVTARAQTNSRILLRFM
jgi:hypothetical protein